MKRSNQILAVVLAVQIVLGAVVFWPEKATGLTEGASLFAGLQADQIVRLTIQDASGNRLTLAQSGGAWVLAEADDFPTTGKVAEFIEKIVQLQADRLITQTASSHKRLKVTDSDFERWITFELADGAVHNLYLGTTPSYGAVHVRADDTDEVYLASGLSASDANAQASAWIDTLYFSAPTDDMVALTLQNASGTLDFEKGENGAWTMKGLSADETFLESSLTTLLNRLSSLRMSRPLGKQQKEEYGLAEPLAVITLQTRDAAGVSKTYSLRVGARSETDESYAVISSESPYVVHVSSYTAGDFVDKTRQDFIELPPTPTPEPTAEATPTGS
ncbi:MAG: DUF4340 domain-containing protein [Chloroflexota bacterium]